MQKYFCNPCGYTYDPEKGDPEHGIAPGTAFELKYKAVDSDKRQGSFDGFPDGAGGNGNFISHDPAGICRKRRSLFCDFSDCDRGGGYRMKSIAIGLLSSGLKSRAALRVIETFVSRIGNAG